MEARVRLGSRVLVAGATPGEVGGADRSTPDAECPMKPDDGAPAGSAPAIPSEDAPASPGDDTLAIPVDDASAIISDDALAIPSKLDVPVVPDDDETSTLDDPSREADVILVFRWGFESSCLPCPRTFCGQGWRWHK